MSLETQNIIKLTTQSSMKDNYADITLVELLEKQLIKTPEALAVTFEGLSITYWQLHQQSNQLAHYFRNQGITHDTIVAVYLPRSIQLVILLLSILKAGGGYLPIDIRQPAKRVETMLMDSQATFCITNDNSILSKKSLEYCKIITLDNLLKKTESCSHEQLNIINKPNDVSYLIYTSGSTGDPKGVANIHAGTVNRLVWMQEQFQLTTKDRVLQKTSLSFDVAVWEFWWPLISGAQLVLASPCAELDIDLLIRDIDIYQINVIHFVPSQLKTILATNKLAACKSLQLVISSGEALTKSTCETFQQQSKAELYNLYGPTEASIDVCFYHYQNDTSETIPIGKPINNIKLYILDEKQSLVKAGEIGELYITGIGLAQGYWRKPELTASKFFEITPLPNFKIRAYRSGDLVKLLEDGNLEFIGRIDEQIKIRGFRVEPAEIEATLLKLPIIKQAVVALKKMPNGHKSLVGYLVKNTTIIEKNNFNDDELYLFLKDQLPDYMIPSQLIWLEHLPLTISGKLDKHALPKPACRSKTNTINKPTSHIEKILVEIWEKFLNISPISTQDNFFSLGGDSLLAMLIANAAGKKDIYFNAQTLMIHRNIYALTKILTQTKNSLQKPVPKKTINFIFQHPIYQARVAKILTEEQVNLKNVEGIYPATPMQQGMVFHTIQNPGIGMYIDQILINIQGYINEQVFIRAWETLILRHDALRTGFYLTEFDFPQQVIYKSCPLSFSHYNISSFNKIEQEHVIANYAEKIRNQGFNLKKPPLFNVALFSLREDKSCILYSDYHSISDALTQGILFKELLLLYHIYLTNNPNSLPPAPSFINYVEWQEQQDKQKAEQYWQQLLKTLKNVTMMDVDKQPHVLCNASKKYHNQIINLPKHKVEIIKSFAKQEQVTLNTVIQATWAILLTRYCNEQTIVYALLESGRQIDLPGIAEYVGAFSVALPIFSQINSTITTRKLLQSLQQQVIQSSSFGYYPLSDIQKLCHLSHQAPLLRYAITFPNHTVEQLLENPVNIDGLIITNLSRFTKSHYPLTVSVMPCKDSLTFDIAYDPAYFDHETIRNFSLHWQNLLDNIVNYPEWNASVVPMLTKEEYLLLNEWNNTEAYYPKKHTMLDLIEQQTLAYPNKIAIFLENTQISYKMLYQKSNQLANYLIKKKVKAQKPIVMILPKDCDAIICLLAILKVGGIYTPLDPQLPSVRFQELLIAVESSVIISKGSIILEKNIKNLPETVLILLDECTDEIQTMPTSLPQNKIEPNDIAYILHTSGSTGKPKGIAQTYKTLTNLFFGQNNLLPCTSNKNVLQFASLVFDVSLQEITYALCNGGTLYLSPSKIKESILVLLDYIEKYAIGTVFLPTALLALIAEVGVAKRYLLASLQQIIVAGEALHITEIIREFFKKKSHIRLINQYGPTETHVVSQFIFPKKVKEWPISPPIGIPINNVKLYVLDQFMQLGPPGIAGELYIAGDNLAQGYWNNEKETTERFINLPLVQQSIRLYRSGDKVRREKNGNLTYLGRLDEQLKIRGYRIEPIEIVNMVLKIPQVSQCHVFAHQCDNTVSQLVCYIKLKEKEKYTTHQIKHYLSEQLPAYMIPEKIVIADNLPLTLNGKLDRNALLCSGKSSETQSITEYQDPDKKQLLTICSKILCSSTLGLNQDFFDVGANSISLLKLSLRLEKHFQIKISLRDILLYPSVQSLYNLIKRNKLYDKPMDVEVN